jgi:ATP-dependent DNA ligase
VREYRAVPMEPRPTVGSPRTSFSSYRLIVRRDGSAVRLFTLRGHDWTERYPALGPRQPSFGPVHTPSMARRCGQDGVAVFEALRRRHRATAQRVE